MKTRRCTKCGVEKSLDAFSRNSRGPLGINVWCRQCAKECQAKYQERSEQRRVFCSTKTTKKCTKCRETKEKSEFYRTLSSCDGYEAQCKKCRKRRAPGVGRRYHLKHVYGMDSNEFDAMLLDQGGKCAICGTTQPRGSHNVFHVDHDHLTGKVRALLCDCCNRGLGYFQDDLERLEAAAAYLRRFQV